MQKTFLFAIAALLLIGCRASPLNENEVAVYDSEAESNDNNEVSFETSGEGEVNEGGEDNDRMSAEQMNRVMVDAGAKLAGVIVTLIGLAGGPTAPLSIGIAVVSFILTELTKERRSLWDQIEEKVDLKIGKKLAEYHVDRLKAEVFRVLESRIQDTENFGPADLRIILDKKHIVFPHNWPTLAWSYQLPLGIIYWMPFMIAGYQQLIKEKKKPSCALANEMATARANIITSMKMMLRKRYEDLQGTKYSTDRQNYDCNKKKAGKGKKGGVKRFGRLGGSNEKVCVSIDRLLTWDDGLDGKKFTVRKRHTGWVGDSWKTKFNNVRDATVDFLWKEVVEKVNNFFDPAICLESLGCSCPKKIEKSEIVFSFPNECISNGADGTCMHPCDGFGYGYEWCYINRNPDQWSYCTKPDLNDCMRVSVPPITFPNVLPKRRGSRTE